MYGGKEADDDDNYQVNQAKIAIAKGKWIGLGPGNSEQRNFLPHPYSDFIFAIIIEEYGLIGGLFIIFIYLVFLFEVYASLRNALMHLAPSSRYR